MFTKLAEMVKRYEYLSEELLSPSILADMSVWQKYSKEQAELRETVEKYQQYLRVKKEQEEIFQLLEVEEDPEMKGMLQKEGEACKRQLPELEKELRLLLLPKDKRDEKNCILEIRGGAGGEEAALCLPSLQNVRVLRHKTQA